jgi:peptide/nickel transport system substrate-binding protein
MMVRRPFIPLLALVVFLAGCANPPSGAGSAGGGSQPQPAPTQPSKTLRVVIRSEPASLGATILIPTGITTSFQRRVFNAGLVTRAADGSHPAYLAESVPQLNSDSWRVFPDGRMETTYRLKPNLTWHDGSPLTADDFVFAWQVYTTPDYGTSGSKPHGQMAEVVAPDPRTVLIRWKQPYPEAAQLWEQEFGPLPRRILEPSYQADKESFPGGPFWTSEYVGAGPYKVDRWEPGAFTEATAFDGHALGRPKIDRLRITWNADFNATLAALLAGEADVPANDSIRVDQGLILEHEWSARNAGTVVYRPQLPRFVQVQHRADYANPQAVRDVRVRRALAHAIDKSPINETLFQGKGLTSDSLIYPTLDYFPMVDQATAKYPYDLRRTDQLMTEAGFPKDGAGNYLTPAGARLNFELRNIQSAQNDSERAIIADGWRRAGFEVEENVFTPVQTSDGQTLGTFRSLSITSAQATPEGLNLDDFTSRSASRPETRWFGQNRGGWTNLDYDRTIDAWLTTLDQNERHRLVAQAAKIITEDLGLIPLHFNPAAVAYRTGLTGVQLKAPDVDMMWNIHEWEYR